jgi:DGQHR domain-containing protein
MKETIRIPAIEVRQSENRLLYTFAIDGKQVHRFATISRIRRSDKGSLEGYQRPEVVSHINEIKTYIESEDPMIPNAVVLAFDSRVRFEPNGNFDGGYSRSGDLVIPIDDELSPEQRPAFVVDGQQRLAAIRDAAIDSFPICVSAFITDDNHLQTEQFILVNSTKPLPKGLIYELLPSTETHLPSFLARRRLPTVLLTRLNRDPASPFFGIIQTPTSPEGYVKDNSVLKMAENSLSDGLLYRLCRAAGEDTDVESMLGALFNFWGAVQDVFTPQWALPPKRCRLLHGAGVVSLGFLMDAIADRYRRSDFPTKQQFTNNLKPLAASCRWAEGYWEFGPGQQRRWNEIQNTSKDIQMLSNYLLIQYKSLVWNQSRSRNDRQMDLTTSHD